MRKTIVLAAVIFVLVLSLNSCQLLSLLFNSAPQAVAGFVDTSETRITVVTGQTVNFTAEESRDDGEIVAYEWDFGDGNTADEENPTHSYANAGSFRITLKVTDNLGASSRDWLNITVEALSPGNTAPTANAGGNRLAAVDEVITFDASLSHDTDGSIVSYSWDFGDGANGSGVTPSHSYAAAGTYTVNLTVTDNDGASASDVIEATVEDAAVNPVAIIDAPASGLTGESLIFDASQSYDNDGSIIYYQWRFGDDNFAEQAVASHSFAEPGSYLVVLAVLDNDLNEGVSFLEVVITAAPVSNDPPSAAIAGPTVGFTDEVLSFTAAASTDSDGNIVSYAWDFGDGASGSGVNPSHSYAAAGTYMLTLTVTDDGGLSDSATFSVTISDEVNTPPTAGFTSNPVSQFFVDENIDFNASSSSDADGSITNYHWNFGNGHSAQGMKVSYAYANTGDYTVTLTVTDDDGDTDQLSASITISDVSGGIDVLID